MRNVLATAGEIGFDATVSKMIERLCNDGIEHDLGDLDQSALIVELTSRHGMSGIKDLL
ncbi:hypothetical protein [Rhodoferax sp.]|uniref:hypothetical protein n=1 Tax=Rhodoferax sp. TaxID=50421 RepID=UPI0025ED048D|nr:hypothetical protein [Rhodoferax sp.]